MRLTVTTVWPDAGIRADVVIDADPQAPAGELAADLAVLLRGGPSRGSLPRNVVSFPAGQPLGALAAGIGSGGTASVGMGSAGTGSAGTGSAGTASASTGSAGTGAPGAASRFAGPALFIDGHRVPPGQPVADS